ncbi:hypothetical protein E2320_021878 [Naja naja]|nr:hypothetical protein E2320_021878 [Naja naja]
MDGLLTCRQCSKHMESLKDHSFWDFLRTQVRKYFWFILVTVIVLTLWIIHYAWAPPELGRNCPKDQAKGLPNISQLEAEKVALGKQLTKMEKEMQKLRKFMNQSQEKTLQLLEKKQEEADALIKESTGFNQSLVLTRQFLEKEKEKTQSLQSQLKRVEKNATSQVKEAVQREVEKNKVVEEEIKQLKQQLYNLQQMKEQQQMKIQHLEDQLMKHKPIERSKGGLLLGPSLVLLPLLLTSLLL